jgi:hypothetical protein
MAPALDRPGEATRGPRRPGPPGEYTPLYTPLYTSLYRGVYSE